MTGLGGRRSGKTLWLIIAQAQRDAIEMDAAMAKLRKTLGVSAQEAGDRLRAAMGAAVHTGRHWSTHLDITAPEGAPGGDRLAALKALGVSGAAITPLRLNTLGTDLPHSGEQKEPTMPDEPPPAQRETTPEEKRDAWVSLVTELEGIVLRAREAARTRWELGAQAWAADRLLTDLGKLKAPVVPEDPEPGQGTIHELFPGMAEAMEKPLDAEVFMGRVTQDDLATNQLRFDLVETSSTTVEKSVEDDDGRKTHWEAEDGSTLHLLDPFARHYPKTSGDEDDVTCLRCLHLLQARS